MRSMVEGAHRRCGTSSVGPLRQPSAATSPVPGRIELYPIYHGGSDFFAYAPLWVDVTAAPMHFWDPMMSRQTNTGDSALESAAMPRAGGMMITTIITMTTRERGAFG